MITKEIIKKIRGSQKTKAALQMALDKSPATIQRYLDNNDVMLTTATALSTICEYLDVEIDNVLIKENA